MTTTCLDYLRENILAVTTVEIGSGETVELVHDDDTMIRQMIDEILDSPSGADDGTTLGNILDEMPADSNCGSDCTYAIDHAAKFIADIRLAFGYHKPALIIGTVAAVVDVCSCFIRG